MQKTRRPPIAQVKRASKTLADALMAEAERIREDQGHNGHVAAQELEHAAISMGGYAARIEALRRAHS